MEASSWSIRSICGLRVEGEGNKEGEEDMPGRKKRGEKREMEAEGDPVVK